MFLRLKLVLVAFLIAAITDPASGKDSDSEFRIAATIGPIHSLVSMVAKGITSPDLIVRPGASPHHYALSPSEAQALDIADVVFWIGGALEVWMAKAVMTLAEDAVVVELAKVEGVERLTVRKMGVWVGQGKHGLARRHHNHVRTGWVDPHLWLAPQNALIWLSVIAETLAMHDPDHAETYRRNASDAVAAIDATVAEIEGLLRPLKEKPYVVFHDAYQYFEQRFGLHSLGAIRLFDAERPGPARLKHIRETIRTSGAICVFAEPQFEPKLISTIIEGSGAKRGMLDPIGARLQPGPELYPLLMRNLAEGLVDCLG